MWEFLAAGDAGVSIRKGMGGFWNILGAYLGELCIVKIPKADEIITTDKFYCTVGSCCSTDITLLSLSGVDPRWRTRICCCIFFLVENLNIDASKAGDCCDLSSESGNLLPWPFLLHGSAGEIGKGHENEVDFQERWRGRFTIRSCWSLERLKLSRVN